MRCPIHRSLCAFSFALLACGSDPPSSSIDAGSPIDAGSSIDAPSDRFGLALIAGDLGGPGSLDGTGAAAHFYLPSGLAVDSAGNLYVGDAANGTIRKVTAAGVVTTLAGAAGVSGSADGAGAAARFQGPAGVAIDGAGNLYVADWGNHTIRKVTAAGVVTTLAGAPGVSGSTDGTGTAARFHHPWDVAVDSAGNVYVADTRNHAIRKITPAGVVTTWAGTAGVSGSTDGTGAAARFFQPTGVAVDSAGNVYVADTYNGTLRKITAAGIVTTLAGLAGVGGSTDGVGAAARFGGPFSVAVDSAGNVYVADSHNETIRKVTAAGVVTTLAGTMGLANTALGLCSYADGTGPAARFCIPRGVEVDGAGSVYVADTLNDTLRKITPSGVVTTLAGRVGYGSADGTGPAARFGFSFGLAVDSTGTIYVADRGNNTIREVTAAGVVTTLAGTPGTSGNTDGAGAAARFIWPYSVAIDSARNLYVPDYYNHVIRKVTATGVVTTLAGTAGWHGSADGKGAVARFLYPSGVAIDRADNLYVADEYNHTIRKITPGGIVTTLAGTAKAPGGTDGTGAAARFNYPRGMAIDPAGNIYVADNHNHTIRKITPDGIVKTLAGAAGAAGSTDGTGAAARFNYPAGLVVDMAGNVYVADTSNSAIRKITPAGTTTTVAGTAGKAGIILGESPGLAFPTSLALVGDSIVIADSNAVLLLRHGAR